MVDYYGSLYHSDIFRMKSLTRAECLIYATLIAQGGKDRKIKLSQGKIAAFAGVSLASCKRALKKFEQCKWISSKDYFQIKIYLLSVADFSIGHSDAPEQDHLDAPEQAQDHDPHVLNYKNNINSITCTGNNWSIDSLLADAITKEEVIFVRLFERWSSCSKSNWSTPNNHNPLLIWRNIAPLTADILNHVLELKIVDSWLLLHRADQTGKHWRSQAWIKGLKNWMERQVKQGTRTTPNRLSARQKGFYDYSISEFVIPDLPDFDLDEYRRKRELQTESQCTDKDLALTADNVTDPILKQYINYVTDHGRFNPSVNWMQIVDRCRGRFTSLTHDQLDSLHQSCPLLQSVHNSLMIELKYNWR